MSNNIPMYFLTWTIFFLFCSACILDLSLTSHWDSTSTSVHGQSDLSFVVFIFNFLDVLLLALEYRLKHLYVDWQLLFCFVRFWPVLFCVRLPGNCYEKTFKIKLVKKKAPSMTQAEASHTTLFQTD